MMPTDYQGKEQLGLLTGNLVVSGLALLKLWPMAATYPIGVHTHAWTLFWGYRQMTPELVVYLYLVYVVAIAFAALTFVVFHVIGQGVRLATDRWVAFLERFCNWTYSSEFVLLVMLLLITVDAQLKLTELGLRETLLLHLLSERWAEIISRGAFAIATTALFLSSGWWLGRRFSTCAMLPVLFTVCGTLGLGYAAIENCYTLELKVNKQLFEQGRNDVVELDVRLGGATSAVNEAKLLLYKADGALIRNLTLHDLGGGHYLSYLQSSALLLTPVFPFLRSRNEQWVGFVVIP